MSKRDNKKVKLHKKGILVTPLKLDDKENNHEVDIMWFMIRSHLKGWTIPFDLVVILHKNAIDNTYYPTCLVAFYRCVHTPQWKMSKIQRSNSITE